MKKGLYFYLLIIALSFITLFITSCETLDKIDFEGIKSRGTGGTAQDSAVNSEKGSKFSFGKSSVYKIPENYLEAYSYRTDKADKTIQAYIKTKSIDSLRTANPDGYVKNIVAKINETAKNDFERVKFAHDAICLLVSYDAKNYWSGTVPDQDWQNVVKTKTAVCEGYSNLFQKFCSELKIKSKKITGYARGVGTDISNEQSKVSNHAWNSVCVSDNWYLIDCTWDSGYMSGKSSVQSYTTDWLFLKPEYFIYSHFPSDSKNQLLQKPLTAEEFSVLPDFRPKLFELSEGLTSIKKMNNVENLFEFEYKVKDGWNFTFSVGEAGKKELKNRVFTETDNGKSNTKISLPLAGRYMVTVFYKEKNGKTGHSCGQFIIESSKESNIQYPALLNTTSKNAKLILPKQAPLHADETVNFEVYVEDRSFVAVIAGRSLIQLKNDGKGTFSGDVIIPKSIKQVSIGLSKSERGSYETLAVFDVK